MTTRLCPTCCEGALVENAGPGRRMSYRQIPDLPVPADLTIPTCEHCGERFFDRESQDRFTQAMEVVYAAKLTEKSQAALTSLSEAGVRLWELENLLGVSRGYLSKVKGGKETSAQLAATLMLLGADTSRVEELRELWRDEGAGAVHFQPVSVPTMQRLARAQPKLTLVAPLGAMTGEAVAA